MSIHSLDETFARDALKPTGPVMDLDVHETFTSWQEVLPYLAEPWRQLVASNAWTPPSFPFAYCWTPPESNDLLFPHWPLYKAGVVLEANWDGDILWEYKNPNHHHDARRTRNGNIVLLTIEKTPEDVAWKIQGQIADNGIWSDRIIEVTPAGELLWEWHAWEHLDELIDRPTGFSLSMAECARQHCIGFEIETSPG